MAEKKLRATTFVAGTTYPGGTAEADIPAEHRKLITNERAFVEAGSDDDPTIVQEAPVFGLEPKPSEQAGQPAQPDPAATGQTDPSAATDGEDSPKPVARRSR